MIKFIDKDDDFMIIFSENPEEIEYLKKITKTTLEIVYDGFPAIIVRKEKLSAV